VSSWAQRRIRFTRNQQKRRSSIAMALQDDRI
jgi:hypothetical protein